MQNTSTTPQLSTEEAAEFLGFAPYTLRRSRCIGELAGITAPPYRKLGRKVVYERAALIEWLKQFEPITNTAQEVR